MTDADEAVPTLFPALDVWVDQWLLPRHEHTLDDETKWCSKWWSHPEAVSRLDSLWMAWEAARLGPAGDMSQWWTYHHASHMRALTDPRGTFRHCHPARHHDPAEHARGSRWPSDLGPRELFERIGQDDD